MAADHLMKQFKQLQQSQQQQQECSKALNIEMTTPIAYEPKQLQEAEQMWQDLQVVECARLEEQKLSLACVQCTIFAYLALKVFSREHRIHRCIAYQSADHFIVTASEQS